MARAPILGGAGSLSPFGSSGMSFDAFNIAASIGEQAYLIFRKKEILWEQGKLSNADYLTALDGYAKALPEGSEKVNAEVRFTETKYRVERNTLIADIEDGKKEWEDLLSFDTARLNTIQIKDSTAYDEQLSRVREVQQRIFSEQEDVQREKYNDGLITSAQLQRWYQGHLSGALTADNPELEDAINKQLDALNDSVISERDAKMVEDFNAGKVGYNQFLAYGNAARGRYAKGTQQYDDWTDRLDDAKTQATEQSLTYRYGLTQRYEQLAKFVADHGTAPKGHTVSSKGSKGTPRVIWTGSSWKTVYEGGRAGGTRYVGPSASEVKAWKELQVEVKDAKAQMKHIAQQIGAAPGGWVTTKDMTRYYQSIQGKYVKGSPEWYNVQERLDSLYQQQHSEDVLRKQGIRVSYPKVKSERPEVGSTGGAPNLVTPKPSGGPATSVKASVDLAGPSQKAGDRDLTLDEFMKAIARVESGGRYDAVNKNSGARGKYQMMPSNWPGWAGKYLGDPKAEWTPANQEKVARGKMQDLYKWLGDWRAVAHWWLTGGSNKDLHRDPNQWSSSSRRYVNKVFAGLGMSPTQVTSGAIRRASSSSPATAPGAPGGGSGGVAPTSGPKPPTTGAAAKMRSPLSLARGLDGREFERFYQRYLEAYQNGEESFTDSSSGKPITYWIPMDVEERSKLIGELDKLRVGAFSERARAYAGTPSESVAMTNYSDAVKQAGTNQIVILDTISRVDPTKTSAWHVSPETPESAAKSWNPVASALQLKDSAAATLAAYAERVKAAYARGDDELAYTLIQQAQIFAQDNDAILRTYYANATEQISAVRRQTGTSTPEMVERDLAELTKALDLDNSDGTVSPDYAKAFADMDETATELQKFLKLDANGEPVKRQLNDDQDHFVYKDGVDLFLKPDGTIEHKQTTFDGYASPTTGIRDKGQYVTVTVKVGQSVKQVKAQWTPGVVGFIKDSGIPVYGKIITGQMNGQEYVWVENPFAAGKWIRGRTDQALVIDAPAGLKPITGPDGTPSLEFNMGGGPKGGGSGTFRLMWDQKTGAYHVYEAPGLFGGDWVDRGSTSDSTFAGLTTMLAGAGWKVDTTNLRGEDAYFANQTGAWIGFDQKSHQQLIKNTQGPKAGVKTPKVLVPGQTFKSYGNDTLADLSNEKAARRQLNRPLPSPFTDGMTAAEKTKAGAFGSKPAAGRLPQVDVSTTRAESTRGAAFGPVPRKAARPTTSSGPKAGGARKAGTSTVPKKPKPKPKPLPKITPIKKHEATGTNTYSGGR